MAQSGRNPEWVHPMNATLTMEQAGKAHDLALVAARKSESARRYYRYAIEQFCQFMQEQNGVDTPTIGDMTPLNVRSWAVWLGETPTYTGTRKRTRGATTIHARVMALKILCLFLVEEEIISANPLIKVKLPRVPEREVDPFTPEEIRRLIDATNFHGMQRRNKAILYLMVATGLRANELCTLTMDQLNLKAGTCRVIGKGDKQRSVQFDKMTAKYIALYLAERPATPAAADRVFVASRGRPLTPSSLYGMLASLADTAGVENAHPHRLRHTAATLFLEGHPGFVFHLQDMLGHNTLEQSRRYAKVIRRKEGLEGPSNVDLLHLRGAS